MMMTYQCPTSAHLTRQISKQKENTDPCTFGKPKETILINNQGINLKGSTPIAEVTQSDRDLLRKLRLYV